MKFCALCESHTVKHTHQGAIIFRCRCLNETIGTPADTLMAEGVIAAEESSQKHEVFIEQAPFDPARNIVAKPCPKCRMPFLTLILVGVNQQSLLVCECGYRASSKEHAANVSASIAKSEPAES